MITDLNEFKRDQARLCNLDYVVDASNGLNTAILDRFGPDRCDLIFECVGVQDTITKALANARKGSTIVIVGVFGEKPLVDLGLVQDRELNLIGTLMYQKKDYQVAIDLVSERRLALDLMVSRHYAFLQYLDAYRDIDHAHGNIMKVMIDL
jgi:L-iditol 2-dehydrogenase